MAKISALGEAGEMKAVEVNPIDMSVQARNHDVDRLGQACEIRQWHPPE
jgi:hypothetical protein